MAEKNKRFAKLEQEFSNSTPIVDSPDKIINDLLHAEKEIANETLSMMKSRYEREKRIWEKNYAEKESERIIISRKFAETQERIKYLEQQLSEIRQDQIDQLQLTAKELEAKKQLENNKWNKISDEIRKYRDKMFSSEKRLTGEQERLRLLRKTFNEQKAVLDEQIRIKDAELALLHEESLEKEEGWFNERSRREEEAGLLKEKVDDLQKEIEQENQGHAAEKGKKDEELSKLGQSCQEIILKLNAEQAKRKQAEDSAAINLKQLQEMDVEKQKIKQDAERNRFEWRKMLHEEQRKWDEYKKEISAREDELQKQTEEKIKSILASVELVEQRLSDEKKFRKQLESSIKDKDVEIQRLMIQREELLPAQKKTDELKVLEVKNSMLNERNIQMMSQLSQMDDDIKKERKELQDLLSRKLEDEHKKHAEMLEFEEKERKQLEKEYKSRIEHLEQTISELRGGVSDKSE